ncbi:MAG TPA: chromate transporter [Myxococcales bacterium]|nr:chromate transporter [Myxococcales bacterium]
MTSDSGDAPAWSVLAPMFFHFAVLSLMAIGGGVVMIAPEMQRFVVDSHHWISAEQFSAAYALAQAAPGPNFLYITLVGWEVAGWAGAAAATIATLAPPAVLSVAMIRASANRAPGRLARAIGKGLVPISVGLVFATGWVLLRGSGSWQWRGATLALVAAAVIFRTRINPVFVIAAGAVVGVAGFV